MQRGCWKRVRWHAAGAKLIELPEHGDLARWTGPASEPKGAKLCSLGVRSEQRPRVQVGFAFNRIESALSYLVNHLARFSGLAAQTERLDALFAGVRSQPRVAVGSPCAVWCPAMGWRASHRPTRVLPEAWAGL